MFFVCKGFQGLMTFDLSRQEYNRENCLRRKIKSQKKESSLFENKRIKKGNIGQKMEICSIVVIVTLTCKSRDRRDI